jgi:putative transcriptional regulator
MPRRLRALLLAGLAAVGAAAQTEDRLEAQLKPGAFLFAHPRLGDPNFVATVVVLAHKDEGGTMGLIINKPTDVRLGDVLPKVKGTREFAVPVYFGGPVSGESMIVLLRSPRRPEGSHLVIGDVYMTGKLEELARALVLKQAETRLRVYAGYAGWAPGQLEGELRRGDWVVARGDADKIFTRDPSRLWEEVHQLLRRIEAGAPVAGPRPLAPPGRGPRAPGSPRSPAR